MTSTGSFAPRHSAALAPLIVVFLLLTIFGSLALPVRAADDWNSGPLTQVPTLNPQQLSSALGTLSQGTNSTQLQQLISLFQSEMDSGNYTAAASTLVQLKGLSADQDNSQALNALLQSLSVGSNGASVNGTMLASLLSAASSPPYQTGSSSQSKQTVSLDMLSLANLLQYVNGTLASELLQKEGLGGDLGGSNSTAAGKTGLVPGNLPGLSGFSGLSMPSLDAPSLSVATPSTSVSALPLAEIAIPMFIVAAAVAIFYSRARIMTRLAGAQSLLGSAPDGTRGHGGEGNNDLAAGAGTAGAPTNPRAKIEFYFGKAVRLMARRGVQKPDSETAREFTARCEGSPERPHVNTISSLYEKAKFSGQDVGGPEANLAATSFHAMEREES
jgi:Domain of unknown function (DUF4129)